MIWTLQRRGFYTSGDYTIERTPAASSTWRDVWVAKHLDQVIDYTHTLAKAKQAAKEYQVAREAGR